MVVVRGVCGFLRLCRCDLAESSLLVRAALQSRFDDELGQPWNCRHFISNSISDRGTGGSLSRGRSIGSEGGHPTIRVDSRRDVVGLASGVRIFASTPRAHQAALAGDDICFRSAAADHRHLPLQRRRSPRVVHSSYLRGGDLHLRSGLLRVDQPRAPAHTDKVALEDGFPANDQLPNNRDLKARTRARRTRTRSTLHA